MLTEVLLVIVVLFLAVYWYVARSFGYFKKHGVAEEPGTFPFGSDASWKVWVGGLSFLKLWDEGCEKHSKEKMFGFYHFGQKNLVVNDLELAKLIAIKDADHFTDRQVIGTQYKDSTKEIEKIFSLMLTNMTGDEWKKMRTIVSPVFTSGKLKLMIPHIDKCGDNMADMLNTAAISGEILEAKDMYGKFTLDSIATSGFGIESNSYKDPENQFRVNAMKLTRDPKYASYKDILKFFVIAIAPKIAQFFEIFFFDKDCTYFFVNIVRKSIEYRRKTGFKRNDIIDIFIDELDKDRKDVFLPREDFEIGLVSTAILFFFAGFDTTSTTLSVVVFGLIHHPEVQEKLRQEIEEVIGDSEKITGDHLKDLKYTENVINECMRKYFQFSIQRSCTKDYPVEGTNYTIPKGMLVNIPRPSNCFKQEDVFDPDNWEPENKPNKFGFLGFGQGPRNCIGMRYAYQTLKIAIIHTVRRFRLIKCDETVDEDGLNFSPTKNGFVGGIKFRVEALNMNEE